MKTNTMMRVASVLLVAVLLSTCAIAGTYAKYVTSASGTDTARVAKWNITMKNDSSATFVDQYDSADDVQVDGNSATGVVAPGTQGSTKYEVDGTPETDYVITFSSSGVVDVYLGAGTYTYKATENGNDAQYGAATTVASGDDYYPISYTVTIKTTNGSVQDVNTSAKSQILNPEGTGNVIDLTNVSCIYPSLEAALADLAKVEVGYEQNEVCDLEVTIAWEWAFHNTQNAADQYDTILGDLATKLDNDNNDTATKNAHLTASEGAKYSTKIAYTLTMTATQVGD